MKEIYSFLSELSQNNNREWFNANKDNYLKIRKTFEDFAQALIERIAQWDEDVAASNLSVKDCTYRIYRDTRFSKNKDPYKTHMGIFICKGGKKSPYAGYYLHIEPSGENNFTGLIESSGENTLSGLKESSGENTLSGPKEPSGENTLSGLKEPSGENTLSGPKEQSGENTLPDSSQKGVHTQTPLSMGGSFIIAGTYRYESKVLRSIRDEISVNGDSFLDAIRQAEGFYTEESDMLKKVPAEFSFAPDKWHNLLRYKTFALIKPIDDNYVCAPDALDNIAKDFRSCSTFLKKVNMAMDYAYEEM